MGLLRRQYTTKEREKWEKINKIIFFSPMEMGIENGDGYGNGKHNDTQQDAHCIPIALVAHSFVRSFIHSFTSFIHSFIRGN